MPRKQDKREENGPPAAGSLSAEARAKEEIAQLRQQCNSLALRGHYKECFKLIEDNLRLLFFKERWPENFYKSLKIHRRCYPSMHIDSGYEEYLSGLLRKNGIPWVFALFFKSADTSIDWTSDYFRDLALVSEGKGDFEEALGYCDLLLKIDPASSNGYLLKGWILEGMERHEDAAAQYEQALSLSSKNYQAHQSLANHYIRKKAPEKALYHVEKALELSQSDASLYATKAKLEAEKGNRQEALAACEKAMLLDPANPEYPYRKGELLLGDKQELAAMRQYSKAVGLDERHLPSLKRLAALLRDTQPEAALPYINTVTTLEPDNLEAALLKANLHRKTGDDAGAVRQYRRVLELDEKNVEAYGSIGCLLLALDAEKALQAFDKAVELAPDNGAYHFGRAVALQKMGKHDEAVKEYKTTVSLDKTNAKAYGELGYLHAEQLPREAIRYFDRAIALDGQNPYYYAAKAETMLKLPHKPEEAIECFHAAVQRDPGNAGLQYRLAAFLEKAGNDASAVEHYRVAVSLDQTLRGAYLGLARLLLETEPETALLHINSAIDLDPNEGDFYYVKAQILSRLGGRMKSAELLKKAAYADQAKNDAIMQEISQMLSGDSLRISLMYINRAIELRPENSEYVRARADILFEAGQKGRAFDQYEAAIKLDDQNHAAWFGAGRALAERKGREKEALEHYDRAIALAPAVAKYSACKANLLSKSHETYQEALACYDAAISLDRQDWAVILEKAELLYQKGDLLAAQESFRRCLLANPHCAPANARMAALLADTKPVAALLYIDHALAIEPEIALHHMWRGRLLYALGDGAGAEKAFKAAVALGQDGAEAYFLLAQVVYKRMPEMGLKYCRGAMERRPDMTEAHLLCGNIYLLLGEKDCALESFQAAMNLNGKCHEAMARAAALQFERLAARQGEGAGGGEADCFALIDKALALDPENVEYLTIKAAMLEGREPPRLDEAITVMARAVKYMPEKLPYREKLVELLGRKNAFFRHMLEKNKLEKLRRARQRREEELARMENVIPPLPQQEQPEEAPSGQEYTQITSKQ